MARADVSVDPDVRTLVNNGRARVLVELRVDEAADPTRRTDAISRVQEHVLARLPGTHASVTRRYASIPLLALDIDAAGLRLLEGMNDLVMSVRLDRTVRTQ